MHASKGDADLSFGPRLKFTLQVLITGGQIFPYSSSFEKRSQPDRRERLSKTDQLSAQFARESQGELEKGIVLRDVSTCPAFNFLKPTRRLPCLPRLFRPRICLKKPKQYKCTFVPLLKLWLLLKVGKQNAVVWTASRQAHTI